MRDEKAKIEAIWQTLHGMPEPAFQEVRTSAFLAERLARAGYKVQINPGLEGAGHVEEMKGKLSPEDICPKGQVGVVGILDSGKAGPTVALRSDMDCLMFKQEDGQEIGIHACGHDAHMSMVLTAAEQLAQRGLNRGRLKILFQPAEEIGKGALFFLAAGVLDDVDYLFGIHVLGRDMAKSGQVIPAVQWTACTLLEAELTGRAAHGSKPQLGLNVIDAGAAIVQAVNAIRMDPLKGSNVKATRFLAGGGSLNAICAKAQLGFDLRSTSNTEMKNLLEKVTQAVTLTSAVFGVQAKLQKVGDCPAAEFDHTLVEIARQAILEEVGQAGLLPPTATTIGEDFNFYPLKKPHLKTAFIGLGCDLEPGLHDPNMHFNHADMLHGVHILSSMALKALDL